MTQNLSNSLAMILDALEPNSNQAGSRPTPTTPAQNGPQRRMALFPPPTPPNHSGPHRRMAMDVQSRINNILDEAEVHVRARQRFRRDLSNARRRRVCGPAYRNSYERYEEDVEQAVDRLELSYEGTIVLMQAIWDMEEVTMREDTGRGVRRVNGWGMGDIMDLSGVGQSQGGGERGGRGGVGVGQQRSGEAQRDLEMNDDQRDQQGAAHMPARR